MIILISPFLSNSGQNLRLGFESFESLSSDIIVQIRVKLIDINEFTKKMKKITEHLRNEILITQIIYESSVNEQRRLCSRYLAEDMI